MLLKFKFSQPPKHNTILVVGNVSSIGSWDPDKAVQLELMAEGMMTKDIEITNALEASNIEYKYILNHGSRLEWETGENRIVNLEQQFNRAVQLIEENIQLTVTVEDLRFNQTGAGWPHINTSQFILPPPIVPNQFEDELENLDAILPIVKTKPGAASVVTQPNSMPNRDSEPLSSSQNISTFSKNMKILSKMPQNMGTDDVRKAPFELPTDPTTLRSNAPSGNYSQEMSQIANEQKISHVVQHGFQGAQNFQKQRSQEFGGLSATEENESAARIDDEETIMAYKEMLKNINQQKYKDIHMQISDRHPMESQKQLLESKKQLVESERQPAESAIGKANLLNIKKSKHMASVQVPHRQSMDPSGENMNQVEESEGCDNSMNKLSSNIDEMQIKEKFKRIAPNEQQVSVQQYFEQNPQGSQKIEVCQNTAADVGQNDLAEPKLKNLQQQEMTGMKLPPLSDHKNIKEDSIQNSKAIQKNQLEDLPSSPRTEPKQQPKLMLNEDKLAKDYTLDEKMETKAQLPNGLKMPELQTGQQQSQNTSVQIPSALSNEDNTANNQGIILESHTGPICQIDEIDDLSVATVGLLKDAVCHCLNMAEWVQRNHIQLYYNGVALLNDNSILEDYDVKGGAKINYIIMIA